MAAVSCGSFRGTVLDLDHFEDVEAHTDANFVLTGGGKFVEDPGGRPSSIRLRGDPVADGARREGHRRIDADGTRGALGLMGAGLTSKPGDCLVIVMHNAGKLAELSELMAPFDLISCRRVRSGSPEPEEDWDDVRRNARLKAHAAAKASGTTASSMT